MTSRIAARIQRQAVSNVSGNLQSPPLSPLRRIPTHAFPASPRMATIAGGIGTSSVRMFSPPSSITQSAARRMQMVSSPQQPSLFSPTSVLRCLAAASPICAVAVTEDEDTQQTGGGCSELCSTGKPPPPEQREVTAAAITTTAKTSHSTVSDSVLTAL